MLWGLERLPDLAAHNVVCDIVDAIVAELRIAQARNRIVFVKTLLRFGRRLDVPLEKRFIEGTCNFLGQLSFARAGLALDQYWSLKRDRRVDGQR